MPTKKGYEQTGVAVRARRHRNGLRGAGLRPVQLWLPDTRRAGFAADCRNQCLVVRVAKPARGRRIEMRRGDLIALVGPGRPQLALVIQRDQFSAHASVTILPITREPQAAPLLRVSITPSEGSAPLAPLQVMIDQMRAVPRRKVRLVIGRLTAESLLAVNRALAIFLGIDSPITPG
jgi:mRNA interferase MazF